MKKWAILLCVVMLCFNFVACGSTDGSNSTDSADADLKTSGNIIENEEQFDTSADSKKTENTEQVLEPEKTNVTVADFEELLCKMPVYVKSTKYVVQDERYKSLYPDMLQAVLQNNTTADIKNAVVAFVAWDKNNLPVKIKGSSDFSDGSYIKRVNYSDINLIPDSTFGEANGFSVDADCGIEQFKAIVVSFETFEGDTWENPYFDEWCTLYEGVKYSNDLVVDVTIENTVLETTHTDENDESSIETDERKLLAQIEEQEFRVISTKYVVQDEKYKSLYPDMLQAVLRNDTLYDIKNASVAFVAWDKNNLPVKIKGSTDFSDGSYIKLVNYSDINLIPGATYGESSGFSVDENCAIATFKAIVVTYESFNGDTWENPLYDEWCTLYEGVKLQ